MTILMTAILMMTLIRMMTKSDDRAGGLSLFRGQPSGPGHISLSRRFGPN